MSYIDVLTNGPTGPFKELKLHSAIKIAEKSDLEEYKKGIRFAISKKEITDKVRQFFSGLLALKEYYYKDDVLVILASDYKSKLTKHNKEETDLTTFIGEQIQIVNEKYTTVKKIKETTLSLSIFKDSEHKQMLEDKKQFYTSIINNKEQLPHFAELFDVKIDKEDQKLIPGLIKDVVLTTEEKTGFTEEEQILKRKIKTILSSFTFDYDIAFQTGKPVSPYVYTLREFLKSINYVREENLSINQMINFKIWKKPLFNSNRDWLLLKSPNYAYTQFEKVVSFEYQIMDFLLRQQLIKNDFNDQQIDFILSAYRTCIIGNNNDLDMCYKNSKYIDSGPYFKGTQWFDKGSIEGCNNLCRLSKFAWSLENNKFGIANSAARNLTLSCGIVPYAIRDKYDLQDFDLKYTIGIFIFRRFDELLSKYKYYLYYIYLFKDPLTKKLVVCLFSIYKRRVYLQDAPTHTFRNSYVESKNFIYHRLRYLINNQLIPTPSNDPDCDIKCYRVINTSNQGEVIFFLSLYSKAEILRMYTELQKELNIIYDNVKLNELMAKIIQDINDLEYISEYRLTATTKLYINDSEYIEDTQKRFIWNIDPSELFDKDDPSEQSGKYKPSTKARERSCINSAQYGIIYARDMKQLISFYKGSEENIEELKERLKLTKEDNKERLKLKVSKEDNNEHLNLNLDLKLGEVPKFLIDEQRYLSQDYAYKNHIDRQIEKINLDKLDGDTNLSKYSESFTVYDKLNTLFTKPSSSISKYRNIFTKELFYSNDSVYDQFVIGIGEDVKLYFKLKDYYQNEVYKRYIDNIRKLLLNRRVSYKSKYIKYKSKYFILYNKIYNVDI